MRESSMAAGNALKCRGDACAVATAEKRDAGVISTTAVIKPIIIPMLQNVDLISAMRRLADKRIEEAMREGKFDNLQGAGRPLNLEPMPAEENARMTWWALRILKQNDVVPDEVRWRKSVD